MRIVNQTRGTLLVSAGRQASGFWELLWGLMGKPNLPAGTGLLLPHTNWIHTFWMRFALDVLYLDKAGRVIGLNRALRPNRIGRPCWQASATLELPVGMIDCSQTTVGDVLLMSE